MTIWVLGLIELHYLNQKWRHLSDDVWNFIQFWKKKKFGHLALLFLWRSFFSYGSKYLRNLFHHDDSWPKILLLTVFEGYCCTELMVYGLVPFVPFFIDLHLLSSEKLCWLIKNVVKMGHPLSFEKCLECHPFSFY